VRFNTCVHRETGERPSERLARERAALHAIPDAPYNVALGETRTVSWSSIISFQGARYSVPYQLCEEVVFVRRDGDEVVIVATDANGAREVARHLVGQRGQRPCATSTIRRAAATPSASPVPLLAEEAEFLAIGEGARRYLAEAAITGQRHIEEAAAEAVALVGRTEPGPVDEALGLAALAGRFEPGDLASILRTRREPLRRIGEEHSLQTGTAGWAGLGEEGR
jgi:hypothetical protein